jgi:regulatory protein
MSFVPAATLSLKGRALRLLAAREHSRAELERKLAPFEVTPGEVSRILDDLGAKGFINEQRVIDSLVYRRAGKLGAMRIRQELQAKGLEPEAVQNAVADLAKSDYDRAREIWRKKFNQPAATPAERGKQSRFLASRGFGAEVIRRIVAGSEDDA